MSVSVKQIAEGTTLFVENEMLPAVTGWKLWAASAAVALYAQQTEAIISALMQNKAVAMLGIIDGKGMIDIDKAIDALKNAAQKHGELKIDIPVLDIEFTFREKDIDTLYGYINGTINE